MALITTLILVRHGKAPKTSPEQRDWDRALSEIGTEQSKKLGVKIAGIKFDHVVCSPLPRAVQTIEIATDYRYTITIIGSLACPTDGVHPIDRMFNQLGYKPLSDYFAHELGDHLKIWGRTALERVLDALGEKPNQIVLVGGHAVLQNALGWALCEAVHKDTSIAGDVATEFILETSLGECEAFFLKPRVTLCSGDGGEVFCEHIKLD